MSRAGVPFVQGWCSSIATRPERSWVVRSPSADSPTNCTTLSATSSPSSGGAIFPGRVGGLRMTQEFAHEPAMVSEVVEMFGEVPPGVIVDATVGGGGHAAALLDARPDRIVVGLDRDPMAVAAATERLGPYGRRALVRHSLFSSIEASVRSAVVDLPVVGVLLDLGVSSPQLDQAARGFSYRTDGPLDMRMDPDAPLTAADIVNTLPADALADLLRESGEGRFARLLAQGIVASRPISTTAQLVHAIEDVLPPAARRRRGHPAKRTFQALRIAVNGEVEELEAALSGAIDLVVARGRIVVLSYHSGEDRLVKRRFALAASGGCNCPPGLPCVCGATPLVRVITRGARLASKLELSANPRSASARLRAAERLATPSAEPVLDQPRRPGGR